MISRLRSRSATKTVVVVVGPHRSGTSVTTRIFNLLGLEVGGPLIPPGPHNRSGYWEHSGVVDIHERLLTDLGSNWHDFRPLPSGWELDSIVDQHLENLRSLIEDECAAADIWCVKDPRLCKLLPLWLRLFGQLEIEPSFVITVRNPLEVVLSLMTRDQFGPQKSALIYLGHCLEACVRTQGFSRAFVSFASLLGDWEPTCRRAAAELDLTWPAEPLKCGDDIDRFLRPSERHHVKQENDLGEFTGLEWAQEIYSAMDEACKGEPSRVEQVAGDLWSLYRKAADAFVPATEQERAFAEDKAGVVPVEGAQVRQLQRVAEMSSTLEAQADRVALKLREQLVDVRQRLASTQESLVNLQAGLLEQESIADSLGEKLETEKTLTAHLGTELNQLKSDLNLWQSKYRRTDAELVKLQGHLTGILSSRFYRYTRSARRVWRRLVGST